MIIKDSNLTIMVKDIDKSISFYQSVGFNLKNRWGNHYAQLTAPGIIIGLHPASENHSTGSGNTSIGLQTDDVKGALDLLNKAGIELQMREEEGGQFLHFKDPDGTLLYFIKPKWG